MIHNHLFRLFVAGLAAGLGLMAAEPATAPALRVEFGGQGITALNYAGIDFLGDGAFRVTGATLEGWDGARTQADTGKGTLESDAAKQLLRWQYPWGTVTCEYTVAADRLTLSIGVRNTGTTILRGVSLQPLELTFPQAPKGWIEHFPVLGHNLGGPTINLADVGKAVLAVCNDDVTRPLLVGFPGRKSLTRRGLGVFSANIGWLTPLLDPYLDRPVYPGQEDHYRVSLRFGPAGSTVQALAGDLRAEFRTLFPARLEWRDRRAIGALFLSSAGLNAPHNPRGWLNEKVADFVSPAGVEAFRKRLLDYARTSLEILKGMDAQGVIVWDIEGQEYPHAISYLGDPRSLPPEMEPVADEFFRVFTEAKLRVGVCVRPQLPVRAAYGGGVRQIEVPDPAANLSAKIVYAKKRWGCTLYYVDSNGDPNVPLPAAVFRQVAQAHPDCLLTPEHENPLYYAYTAPYQSFAHFGTTSTPESVRALYPGAFSVNYVADGPIDAKRAEFVAAVKRGDILVVRAWFNDLQNAKIRSLYEEAKGTTPP